jgi:hypothetical protein
MAIDAAVVKMLADAYDETVTEALGQGHSNETAHREGITAAAMFLASMNSMDDAVARAEVEKLGLKPNQ